MIQHVTFLETNNMIFLQHQYEASEKFQSNLTMFVLLEIIAVIQ